MTKSLNIILLYFIMACSISIYILSFTNINYDISPILPLLLSIIFLITSFKIFGYFTLFLFFPFILGFIGDIVSNVFIENIVYLIELQEYSYFTGSTSRLLIPWLIFLLTAFSLVNFLIKKLPVNILYRKKIYDYFFILIGLFLLLILYSGFLFKGIPLLEGISRVQYRTGHPIPVIKFEIYFRLLLLGLGIIYVSTLHYKKSIWIKRYILTLLFFFILYMFLQGSKFTGIWSAFYLFYLPYVFYLYKKNRKISFKYLFIILSITILLVSYIITYYNIMGNNGITIFKSRLAMQGEVWWAIDNKIMKNNLDGEVEQLKNELEYIIFRGDETKVGLKHLMYLIAPSDLVDRYLAKNVTFTSGYPAIALLMFGYFGLLLFQLLAGLLTVLAVWALLVSISKGYIIESIILTKIYWATTSAFGMGYFYKLFDLKIVIYLFVVFIMFNLRYFFKRNKRVKFC